MTTETPDDLDDGPPSDPDEDHQSTLAWHEGRYRASGNPLFVWEAISSCAGHAMLQDSQRRTNQQAVIQQAVQRAIDFKLCPAETGAALLPPLQLPLWVLRYLVCVAAELRYLKEGVDSRKRPPNTLKDKADYETEEAFYEAKEADHEAWCRWRYNPTLDFDPALSRVPNALGLRRQGWNAFRDYAANRARQFDLDSLAAYQSPGLTAQEAGEYNSTAGPTAPHVAEHQGFGLTARQARERLMDELGLQDERSLRRRLSQARRESGLDFIRKRRESDPDET
jgi:hypothetical protein